MKSENGSDEREFLHDLASPIGTSIFLIDAVLEAMQTRNSDPDDLLRLADAYQELQKVKKLLQGRREILIKRGVPSART